MQKACEKCTKRASKRIRKGKRAPRSRNGSHLGPVPRARRVEQELREREEAPHKVEHDVVDVPPGRGAQPRVEDDLRDILDERHGELYVGDGVQE